MAVQETIKTLEQAREIINRLQRQKDTALHEKVRAQAVAYELLSKDLHIKEEGIKAKMFYLQDELNRAIVKRDKVKAELEEARDEIKYLKTKLKNYEKGVGEL